MFLLINYPENCLKGDFAVIKKNYSVHQSKNQKVKTKLEFLADLIDMPADDIREAARIMNEQRLCNHDWVLIWPLDPQEFQCSICKMEIQK